MLEKIHKNHTNGIKIIINKSVMEEYKKYYFKKYPKRRKFPFSTKSGKINPLPPSLNKFIVMLRPEMNNTKQQWKEFAIWFVERHGLTNAQIKKCEITYITYMPTKRRFDLDNTIVSSKVLMDGFVESGMLVDDCVPNINKITLIGGYDKEDPRLEIVINIIN